MKTTAKTRIVQTGIILLIISLLITGIALPAVAKDSRGQSGKSTSSSLVDIVKGEITGIDETEQSFDVLTSDEETVTITTDTETGYFLVKAAPYADSIKERIREKVQVETNMGGRVDDNENFPPGLASRWNEEIFYALQDEALEEGLKANAEEAGGIFNRIRSWFGFSHNFGEAASFEDIEVGDGVIVRMVPDESLAKHVLIIKPSDIVKIEGEVTDVNSDSITVKTEDEDVEISWDENTRVSLTGAIAVEEGQTVSVVYNKETGIAQTISVIP